MKNWERPQVVELSISETEYRWTGIDRDGGYVGDGTTPGHRSWAEVKSGSISES